MGEEDWDKLRPIRMPDKLWADFAEAAAADGKDRSTVVRDYVRRYVAAWKGRRSHDARSDNTPS